MPTSINLSISIFIEMINFIECLVYSCSHIAHAFALHRGYPIVIVYHLRPLAARWRQPSSATSALTAFSIFIEIACII